MELKKLSKEEHRKLMGHEQVPDTNKNHVSLSLFGFDVDPNEISEELQLSPTSSGVKGESYSIGPSENRIEKTSDYSHWQYEWKLSTNEFIGDIIDRFIKEIITPRVEKLVELANTSSVQFQIVQYYYDGCNPGVCIEKEDIKTLAKIGASIDIDIYCLSE